jgi:hypothetical protein
MIVLHGAWLPDGGPGANGQFFLWGENGATRPTNGARRASTTHPFQASAADLVAALDRLTPRANGADSPPRMWREGARILLPSTPEGPRPSPVLRGEEDEAPAALALQPWRIGGLVFGGAEALALLARLPRRGEGLPPGLALGDTLQFWAACARLALELIAGQRYLPAAVADGRAILAAWEPVFADPRDVARRSQLVAAMPPAARALLPPGPDPRPLAPATLLDGFLHSTIGDAVAT